MIIQCDQCSAKFRLDDNKVTESGVKVRCKRCQNIFLVKKEPPQEEPDLDALLGFPPVTAVSPVMPPQAPTPTPEPAPSAPAPEPTFSEDDSSLFFLQADSTPAGPPEVSFPLPVAESPTPVPVPAPDDFSFSFEQELPITEPPATVTAPVPIPDDFSFSFEQEPPVTEPPARSLIEAGPVLTEPVSSEVTGSVPPQPEDDFGFLVADTGTTPFVADEVKPEEKPEAPSWGAFEDFEIELPEPGGHPVAAATEQEPVPDEKVSYSSEAAPIPPVAPEAPLLTGVKDSPLPPTSVPGDNVRGDAIIFDDVEAPFPASRRQSPSLIAIVGMVLAALVVLIVGGGGALYLLNGPEALKKIGLGSVVRLLDAETTGQGRILIRTIEGSYVNNREAGELFVIRGEAVNSYKTPRAGIKVKGLIYNAAGTVILQKFTFCGNPLPQEQLATLPMAKIEEAMNNRLGESYANIGVPPGKSVPFIIVFSGLPKDAADFGVEFAESQAAGQ